MTRRAPTGRAPSREALPTVAREGSSTPRTTPPFGSAHLVVDGRPNSEYRFVESVGGVATVLSVVWPKHLTAGSSRPRLAHDREESQTRMARGREVLRSSESATVPAIRNSVSVGGGHGHHH